MGENATGMSVGEKIVENIRERSVSFWGTISIMTVAVQPYGFQHGIDGPDSVRGRDEAGSFGVPHHIRNRIASACCFL